MIKPLIISFGDPSGISSEIILKAWQMRQSLPPFVVLGDVALLKQRAEFFNINISIEAIDDNGFHNMPQNSLSVLPLKNSFVDTLGTPQSDNAAGIIEAIERGVGYIKDGFASALVTCPISKKPLYEAGYPYPGHTEFLGALAKAMHAKNHQPVMMLAGPQLRTVPITVHIPIHTVSHALTTELIIQTAEITYRDLQTKFGIAQPILAFAGLNPHAGEGGAMGKEDIQIIQPAISYLKNKGIQAIGPLPADTMFHKAAREQYDVALCMYHDQALIPVKTIGFDDTVNVTLGLPFIRTSPDHGTAFDIAKQGIANPQSLIAAMKMAYKMASI